METRDIVKLMNERRSSREFNLHHEISNADLKAIVDAMRLSPSSYGLLNYRVLIFPRSILRKQMNEIFYNQKNFVTASHFLIFVADKGERISNETIEETAALIFQEAAAAEKKKRFIDNFRNQYTSRYWGNPDLANAWSAKQVYIALGVGLVVAEDLGIDNCIMEGFDEAKLTTFLLNHNLIGLDEMPVVGMALGQTLEPVKGPKLRKSWPDFVKVVK